MNLLIEEMESEEQMMDDFWEGYCYGVIVVGGVLMAAT
ncbi:hypothetical protein HMPREF1508_2030 [Shuttleworthella sp. MSX8B]|nr:hypothetical protein HMPREF1508_2030 [Shuttleworthia sp. MSX8B]